MSAKIFVNFSTNDLERATAFYESIGCEVNPMFSSENGNCLVLSDEIYFMILQREFFGTFTKQPVGDARESTQVIVALSCESRVEVDRRYEAGLAAGGVEGRELEDLGFMYTRTLQDIDGYHIELFYMDPEAVEQGPPAS